MYVCVHALSPSASATCHEPRSQGPVYSLCTVTMTYYTEAALDLRSAYVRMSVPCILTMYSYYTEDLSFFVSAFRTPLSLS